MVKASDVLSQTGTRLVKRGQVAGNQTEDIRRGNQQSRVGPAGP